MNTTYPALISYDQDDAAYIAEFPDLPGCLTAGGTAEEAAAMAKEALTGYLLSIMERGMDVPQPSKVRGATMIEPDPSVAFALWLRYARARSGLTLTEAADKLGVKYQSYQKLENPALANPTLKTIKKLEGVFGEHVLAI